MKIERVRNMVRENIENLLTEHYGMIDNLVEKEFLMNIPLTAPPFCFGGTDLYRFLMLVEERFAITIQPEDIRQYGFRTIDEIVRMVERYKSLGGKGE